MTIPMIDSILLVSFGGPESPKEVAPFIENVLHGKPVPEKRKLEVVEHYMHFDGVSPLNQQNRDLIAALCKELNAHQIDLPIYWGNRNWHPLLPDTLKQMKADGKKRALAIFTSAYSSYSGCRQYRENIEAARQDVGVDAPLVEKVRVFFNHPGFIQANVEHITQSLSTLDDATPETTPLLFTAHSIPMSMAENCAYEKQLQETCGLVAAAVNWPNWKLVYQSRSGSPHTPWLEPDVCDTIEQLNQEGIQQVVVSPIGFTSDHMEVLFDLDIEAREKCAALNMAFALAPSAGTHPAFISCLRELIQEQLNPGTEKRALGTMGPAHESCPENCCSFSN